jgi:hypothetical protein
MYQAPVQRVQALPIKAYFIMNSERVQFSLFAVFCADWG